MTLIRQWRSAWRLFSVQAQAVFLARIGVWLIPQWRSAWRLFSVQAQAVFLAGIGVWPILPNDWRAAVPSSVLMGLAAVFLVLGILGRCIAQPSIDAKTKASS